MQTADTLRFRRVKTLQFMGHSGYMQAADIVSRHFDVFDKTRAGGSWSSVTPNTRLSSPSISPAHAAVSEPEPESGEESSEAAVECLHSFIFISSAP